MTTSDAPWLPEEFRTKLEEIGALASRSILAQLQDMAVPKLTVAVPRSLAASALAAGVAMKFPVPDGYDGLVSKLTAASALSAQAAPLLAQLSSIGASSALATARWDGTSLAAQAARLATHATELSRSEPATVVSLEGEVPAKTLTLDGVETPEEFEALLTRDWGLTAEQSREARTFIGWLLAGTATVDQILQGFVGNEDGPQRVLWSAILTLSCLFLIKMCTTSDPGED